MTTGKSTIIPNDFIDLWHDPRPVVSKQTGVVVRSRPRNGVRWTISVAEHSSDRRHGFLGCPPVKYWAQWTDPVAGMTQIFTPLKYWLLHLQFTERLSPYETFTADVAWAFIRRHQNNLIKAPEPCGPVYRRRDKARPIRAKLRTDHLAGVPRERSQRYPCCDVPDPRSVIGRGGRDAGAIRTEHRTQNSIPVSFKRSKKATCFGLPDPRGVIK